jgi:hypothetical protein
VHDPQHITGSTLFQILGKFNTKKSGAKAHELLLSYIWLDTRLHTFRTLTRKQHENITPAKRGQTYSKLTQQVKRGLTSILPLLIVACVIR